MNIIQQINKEFDERGPYTKCDEKNSLAEVMDNGVERLDPEKVKQFLNDAIRRVLGEITYHPFQGRNASVDEMLELLNELDK